MVTYQDAGRMYQNPGSYFSLILVTCFGVKQQVLQQPKTVCNWEIQTIAKNKIGFAMIRKSLRTKNKYLILG